MKNLILFNLPISLLLTGCLGGVSVEKKQDTNNSETNYERVVTVDYGNTQSTNYDDQLSESLGEQGSSNDDSSVEDNYNHTNPSTVTEEGSSDSSSTTSNREYCGVIYKKFNTNEYALKLSNGNFKLSIPSNIEYGLEANLNFPFDSANICINGNLSYGFNKISFANLNSFSGTINVTGLSSSLLVSTNHPDRESFRDSYSNEYCGTVTMESNNHTGVNIYKITTHEGQNYNLKFSTKLGDNTHDPENFVYDNDEIRGENIEISNGNFCFYGNSAPAREELWTYRKFFRVQLISGPWN